MGDVGEEVGFGLGSVFRQFFGLLEAVLVLAHANHRAQGIAETLQDVLIIFGPLPVRIHGIKAHKSPKMVFQKNRKHHITL